MTNLQIAIIYSSMLGSILNEYDKSPKAIMDLKRQVKKFLYKRARSNQKEFTEAIRIGQKVWVDAINKFAEDEIKIDSFAIIIALWSSEAKTLTKFVNLSEKRMEKFSMANSSDLLSPELDAYRVAGFINNAIKEVA